MIIIIKTIERFFRNTPNIDIYLAKKYNINGKYKSKILFNKVIKDNKYDFDTGYTKYNWKYDIIGRR